MVTIYFTQQKMNPTPLRVSAMTMFGRLNQVPNIDKLFDDAVIIPYWWIGEGIIKIEVGGVKKGMCKDDILKTLVKSKKSFANQWSLVFRLCIHPITHVYKEVNIKLFRNGGFQMTGITSEEMGHSAISRLIELNVETGVWDTKPNILKLNVCMMMSDYKIGKVILRDKLFMILLKEYGLQCSYEPTLYQGVNTKFFWNNVRPIKSPPGICACPLPCDGSGSGYGVGNCKKITISPFRTGSIIITGAHNMIQLHDAYLFINSVLKTYESDVLRNIIEDAPVKRMSKYPLNTTRDILLYKMRSSPRNKINLEAGLT